jgi:hypothetical protein
MRLERACLISKKTHSGGAIQATTVNISRCGALIRAHANGDVCWKIGEFVLIDLRMQASDNYTPKCMRCAARVVRLDLDGAGAAFVAVEFDRVEFVDMKPAPALAEPELNTSWWM